VAQGFSQGAAWVLDNLAFAGAVAYLAPFGLVGTIAALAYSSGFFPVESQSVAIFAEKAGCLYRAFV